MKNRSFFLYVLVPFLTILAGCTNNSDPNLRPLNVGIAAGYAPFISVNAQGEYEGFDIDVINAVGQKMGKDIKLIDLGSMSSLFTALEVGSVDAIIWGLSITQDRCAKVAMINYYGERTESYPLLFWNTVPQNMQSINDMNNLTVCVEAGSAQEKVLEEYPLINILYTEKIDDALLNIRYGKADAALVEPAIATKFMRIYPTIQKIDLPLKPEQQEQGVGIAVKKESGYIETITRAVELLKQEGTIVAFAQAWGLV